MLATIRLALAPASVLAASDEFCKTYAQRAVEQYQLMASHPTCKVPDDLRWQANYDNHFNGCRAMPKLLMQSEQNMRESHLQSCGAHTATPASAAQEPTQRGSAQSVAAASAPGQPDRGGPVPAAAAAAHPTAQMPPRPAPYQVKHYAMGSCQMPIELRKELLGTNSGTGLVAEFVKGTLSYHTTPGWAHSKDPSLANMSISTNSPVVTTPVQRPKFFFTNCRNFPSDSLGGPWVGSSVAGLGARFLWIEGSGAIAWSELSPKQTLEFLTRTAN